MTRCQICGRRVGTLANGNIRSHHFNSDLCEGVGHPPIEECDIRLEQIAARASEREGALISELAELFERRANWIEPRIYADLLKATTVARRLERRLRRHRSWPQRFARQMEQQGWGDPPPAYMARIGE
jgi:hypothetical protein